MFNSDNSESSRDDDRLTEEEIEELIAQLDSGSRARTEDDDGYDGKCRYNQPLTAAQAWEMMARHDRRRRDLLRAFYDNWEKVEEYESRDQAVREIIYNIGWYVDRDVETVMTVLEDTPLYDNWYGGKEEVELFIETSRAVDGGHYGEYPD